MPSPHALNRFNDGAGNFALRYLASDQNVALLEAAALHGANATGFVAGPLPVRWTVYRYEVTQQLTVVNFTDPTVRTQADTTVQELTGDWLGYYQRSMGTRPPRQRAPTQRLANTIHASTQADGLLAPSAKIPLNENLVLFFGSLPASCLKHTGTTIVTL